MVFTRLVVYKTKQKWFMLIKDPSPSKFTHGPNFLDPMGPGSSLSKTCNEQGYSTPVHTYFIYVYTPIQSSAYFLHIIYIPLKLTLPLMKMFLSIPVSLIIKSRASCPGGRSPPSFIHQVIIITGLNKLRLQLYLLALKTALDADRA